jgi:hypothetical protein
MSDATAEAISCLTKAVRDFTEQCKVEWEHNRSRARLATISDLIDMEIRMGLKISELKTEVGAIRTQVKKIWDEQQKKYDDLKKKFTELEEKLAAAELDEETSQEVKDFRAELDAFDETIPDTTG